MPFQPKISKLHRELIIANPQKLSISELARRYNVTRRAIQYIIDPRRRDTALMRSLALARMNDKQARASQSKKRGGPV